MSWKGDVSRSKTILNIHALLRQDLNDVLQVLRDPQLIERRMAPLEQDLGTWLRAQNDQCYDELLGRHPEASAMIEFLQTDRKAMQNRIMQLLEEVPAAYQNSKVRKFPRVFLEFSRRISERMAIEEDQLLPLLEK